jgi:hypothetical protein
MPPCIVPQRMWARSCTSASMEALGHAHAHELHAHELHAWICSSAAPPSPPAARAVARRRRHGTTWPRSVETRACARRGAGKKAGHSAASRERTRWSPRSSNATATRAHGAWCAGGGAGGGISSHVWSFWAAGSPTPRGPKMDSSGPALAHMPLLIRRGYVCKILGALVACNFFLAGRTDRQTD